MPLWADPITVVIWNTGSFSKGHFNSTSARRMPDRPPLTHFNPLHRGFLILTLGFLSPRIKCIRIISPFFALVCQLREPQRQNTEKRAKLTTSYCMFSQPIAGASRHSRRFCFNRHMRTVFTMDRYQGDLPVSPRMRTMRFKGLPCIQSRKHTLLFISSLLC